MNHRSTAPKAALLGRPNVGKSTLFNRLIRSNRAITHDRPGVTRDRMEGVVRRNGKDAFVLIDTGGVTLDSHAHVEQGPEALQGFEEAILRQAMDAVDESALLCLVVDGREGLTPFDSHLADYLRKTGKPLLLVVNKVDGPEHADLLMSEFHGLGMDVLPCSAAHGFNVRALEDEIQERISQESPIEGMTLTEEEEAMIAAAPRRSRKSLREGLLSDKAAEAAGSEASQFSEPLAVPEGMDEEALFEADLLAAERELRLTATDQLEIFPEGFDPDQMADPAGLPDDSGQAAGPVEPDGPLRLAILGRPNAGKSSLVNAMCGSDRMIVSDIAGTTRDSVDVDVVIDGMPCTFVDTAGVRRRAKITDTVERYSVNASIKSTTKADVTLLMLDGSEGLTQQDKRLIDLLNERKTPFMVLVNKIDIVPAKLRKEAEKQYAEALVFCKHVPLLFISALKRKNLRRIVPLARQIRQECGVRIPTGRLNRAMEMVLERHQPPVVRRVRPKFFYLTQAESLPPTFVFFVNDAERILPSYARYLERSLRKLFAIAHAPMRVHFRSSHSKRSGKR